MVAQPQSDDASAPAVSVEDQPVGGHIANNAMGGMGGVDDIPIQSNKSAQPTEEA